MNILFLSSWFPYPPDTGGKIRIFNMVKYLSEHHQITFLAFSRSGRVGVNRLKEMGRYCSNIIEPEVMPKPKGIIGYLSPNPRWHSKEMRTKIKEAIKSQCFDVLIAAEILAGFYGAKISSIPRILDNCELTVLIERYKDELNRIKRLYHYYEWRKKRNFTANLARQYDACTVVSEQEKNNLLDLIHEKKHVFIVPNGVDVYTNIGNFGQSQPYSMVYPGALSFHANLDAMEFFLTSIFPLIRSKYSKATLRITGNNTTVELNHLPIGEQFGVILTGYLHDVRPCIAQSKVCIVPLRLGGGTRLKILEAMALGTPVVSTSKGAEGLCVTHGKNILIADSPETFTNAVCQLFKNNALREKIIRNAHKLVTEKYDWKICIQPLNDLIVRLTSFNYIGDSVNV